MMVTFLTLLGIGLLFVGTGAILNYCSSRTSPSLRGRGSKQGEWPLLAEIHDRNQAYMIKALLDEANIDVIVEEDTTLGILYGAKNLTDYSIRVPEKDLPQSRGLLKESSFSHYVQDE